MGVRFPWLTAQLRRCFRLIRRSLWLGQHFRNFWRNQRNARLIRSSVLFDADWYLKEYPDVRASGTDPAEHYLQHGAREGREPSPLFNGRWYLEQYLDIREAGVNPLVHYLCYGAAEGREPRPLLAETPSPQIEYAAIWPPSKPSSNGDGIRTIAVSHNLNREGAPNSQFELINGLHRRGAIEPIVLSPHDGPLRSAYQAAGIATLMVSPPDLSGVAEFEETAGAMARAFRELGAEIVYANTLQAFWAIAVAERAGLPGIWNVRESEPWQSYFDYLTPEIVPWLMRRSVILIVLFSLLTPLAAYGSRSTAGAILRRFTTVSTWTA